MHYTRSLIKIIENTPSLNYNVLFIWAISKIISKEREPKRFKLLHESDSVLFTCNGTL